MTGGSRINTEHLRQCHRGGGGAWGWTFLILRLWLDLSAHTTIVVVCSRPVNTVPLTGVGRCESISCSCLAVSQVRGRRKDIQSAINSLYERALCPRDRVYGHSPPP